MSKVSSILGNTYNKTMETEIQPMLSSVNNNNMRDISNFILTRQSTQDSCLSNEELRIELIWKDLSYSVNENVYKTINGIPYKFVKTNKKIVDNLCGRINSGRLTGILGPNGAGKSTLLECLGGRRKAGLTGQIYVSYKGSVFFIL